ncbi:MAG: BPSS1780 family membrane protein [Betaproteobacteria bacterium]
MRVAQAVGADHALNWYREAMRLWRRGPGTFALLALAVLVTEIVLTLIPVGGTLLAQLVLPLVACGLLYASLAADRGDRPRLAHLVAVFAAPPRAIVAVIASGLVVFAGEAIVAYVLAGANLLEPLTGDPSIEPSTILAIYVAGIAVSLPVTFVPFAVLFDGAGIAEAFAESWRAFVRNPVPMLLYGVLSLALLVLGWATYGVGLVIALPWWAASSYAAWKDVFAVDAGPAPPGASTPRP